MDKKRNDDLSGEWARDEHREGFGGDYAREGGIGSGAKGDTYGFRRSDSSFPFNMYPEGAVDKED